MLDTWLQMHLHLLEHLHLSSVSGTSNIHHEGDLFTFLKVREIPLAKIVSGLQVYFTILIYIKSRIVRNLC